MSKIQNPNEKSKGFIWALVALVVIVAAVIAFILMQGKKTAGESYADHEPVAVNFNVTQDGDVTRLASANATSDATVVTIYEDYSCPHCADLEKATGDDMKAAIEDGSIIVELRSLNFLDRGDDRNTVEGHSTKAGTAAYTVAKSGNAEAFWNFYTILFEDQDQAYGQWDYDDFADVAAQVGADDATVEAIRSGEDLDAFRAMAIANSEKLDADTGTVSSPRVFIGDTEYAGDLTDWVAAATQ